MTDQLQKTEGEPAFTGTDDLGYHYLAVVVGDPARYTPKEFKRPNMAFPEHLGAFVIECHYKERVRVGQRHHKESDLTQFSRHLDHGVAKIHLGLAWPMTQRHKDFFVMLFYLPYRVLDNGVTAAESLLLQALPNPLGSVILLTLILLEHLYNPA